MFRFARDEPNLIAEGLYLGNGTHGNSSSLLQRLGITYVLNVTPYPSRRLGPEFTVLHINIYDHPNVDISKHFDAAFEFIDKAVSDPSHKILVHCEMGMSRSSTMVIMYLMKTFNMTLREALVLTRLRRSITNPNNGFMRHAFQSVLRFPHVFSDTQVFRHLADLEFKLYGKHSVDVSLFNDSFGSGAMFIEIPEAWKQNHPSTPVHPRRIQVAPQPQEPAGPTEDEAADAV